MKLFHGRPWWMWALPTFGLVLLGLIPLFLVSGGRAIFNSADGDYIEVILDPAEPGYESFVLPTPSHLTLGIDDEGNLSMVAIMSLGPNDTGGALLLLPPKTGVSDGRTIADAYGDGGIKAVEFALGEILAIGFTTTNEMTSGTWRSYIGPVAPVDVVLGDPLHEESGIGQMMVIESSCCPYKGNIAIDVEEVGEFINWGTREDSGYLRVTRQQDFLKAWIAELATVNDVLAVPGEIDKGFGRMVWGLSRGEVVLVNVPYVPTPEAETVDLEVLREVIVEMVPFPTSGFSEERSKVRLLDGVGGLDLAGEYSQGLVKAGGQIVVIGNALEYGVETQIIYHVATDSGIAEKFKEALGGGVVIFEPLTDTAFDLTAVIGTDLDDGSKIGK
ncbi:MAG: LytR C-terminal domain-containing protein [Acidimicrobiales bacterium]|nr:LytR C-terminal domain-containing protein [Acidimicrobiales bacterium]